MHTSQDDLQKILDQASLLVEVGGLHVHYKNPKNRYKVLHLAFTEWDDQVCVIYQAQYGKKLIFVRPLSNWLEKVVYNNTTVNRFKCIA